MGNIFGFIGGGGGGATNTGNYLGVAADEAAMIAYTGATRGDYVYREDIPAFYILNGDDPTIAGNWGPFTGASSFATETNAGIVQEATLAQAIAGTDVGSSGARLFVPPSKLNSIFLGNTFGNTLFVNPLNANASDAYTRVQSLGRPDRPFSTLNGAFAVATSVDRVIVVSNITVSVPISVANPNLHLLSNVTITVSAVDLFVMSATTTFIKITGESNSIISLAANNLMNRDNELSFGFYIESIKVTGTGATFRNTTSTGNGSIALGMKIKNSTVTNITQTNQGGDIIAINSNFKNLIRAKAGSSTGSIMHLHNCTVDGTLTIPASVTGVVANTVCSSSPTIPPSIQTFNFASNVPIVLP